MTEIIDALKNGELPAFPITFDLGNIAKVFFMLILAMAIIFMIKKMIG